MFSLASTNASHGPKLYFINNSPQLNKFIRLTLRPQKIHLIIENWSEEEMEKVLLSCRSNIAWAHSLFSYSTNAVPSIGSAILPPWITCEEDDAVERWTAKNANLSGPSHSEVRPDSAVCCLRSSTVIGLFDRTQHLICHLREGLGRCRVRMSLMFIAWLSIKRQRNALAWWKRNSCILV